MLTERKANKMYVSAKPFQGARKFRYYDKKCVAHYVYSTEMPSSERYPGKWKALLVILPFLAFFIYLIFVGIRMMKDPEPLPLAAPSEVYLEDSADVLWHEDYLKYVLKEFETKTGVSPYLMTVNTEYWQDHFESADDYAYYEYINRFEDGQHLLIVYTREDEPVDGVRHCAVGQYCGEEAAALFTDYIYQCFYEKFSDGFNAEDVPLEDAFQDAFILSGDLMMSASQDQIEEGKMTILCSGIAAAILVFILLALFCGGSIEYEEVPMDPLPDDSQY